MRCFAIALCLTSNLLLLPPAAALIYRTDSGYSRAIQPGVACRLRSFDIWTRRNYQSYQIKMYPRKAPYPCRRGIPNAVLTGWYESFQISGRANQACYGRFTQVFTKWGRELKITFSYKGTLRGMTCPLKGKTQTLLFRPGR